MNKLELLNIFKQQFGDDSNIISAQVPGRVNLIGDHTDYNDGLAAPMTINSGVWVTGKISDSDTVQLYSQNFKELMTFDLGKANPKAHDKESWQTAMYGVINEFYLHDLIPSGFKATIWGNVPLGAGLSSSAAVTTCLALWINHVFNVGLNKLDLAKLCQKVEHKYMGVQCGILDQYACLFGQENELLVIDCKALTSQSIPFSLENHSLAVIHSGVPRTLAGSGYNERKSECEQALSIIQKDLSIKSLRSLDTSHIQHLSEVLPSNLYKRCKHVITENQRVIDTIIALNNNDYRKTGQLMNESHLSLSEDYQSSHPQVDELIAVCQNTPGVLGARITGGGFGGCIIALVEKKHESSLQDNIKENYEAKCNLTTKQYNITHNFSAKIIK